MTFDIVAILACIIVAGAGITLFVPKGRLVFVLNLPNVVGGMLLPLILVLMIILCNDRRLLGRFVNGRILNTIAWITTIVMTILTLLIVLTTIFPGLPCATCHRTPSVRHSRRTRQQDARWAERQ